MIRVVQKERGLLAGILLLAFVARVWGIDFGLPNEHARPDERHLIGFTLSMGGNRLNPGFFNYPSLYLYALLAVYGVYFMVGRATGRYQSSMDFITEYGTVPDAFFLLDRGLVAVLGTATVWVTYLTMQRVAGRRAGLFAALMLSLSYLHVRESHFGTVDVPLTFMCTLAVFLMLRAYQEPSTRRLLVAATCVGLAISTKYNAITLGLPLALVLLSTAPGAAGPLRARVAPLARCLGLAFLMVCVGFLLGTPYSVLDFATFKHDLMQELLDKGASKPTTDLGVGYVRHALFTLPHGVGVMALVASVLGACAALRAQPKTALLLLLFPLGWYALVGHSHYVFVRYAVPLVPSICLFAAWGLELLLRFVSARFFAPPWQVVALAAVALSMIVAAPAYNVWQWNRLVRIKDTRVVAAEWIEEHIPAGSSIGMIGPPYIRPDVWASPAAMRQATVNGTTGAGRRLRNELRITFLKKTHKPTFDLVTFEGDRWHNALNAEVAAEPPQYVVVPEHPAWLEATGTVQPALSGYRLVETFVGFTPQAVGALFDLQDAVYFPFARFRGLERPGPNLKLFERHEAR